MADVTAAEALEAFTSLRQAVADAFGFQGLHRDSNGEWILETWDDEQKTGTYLALRAAVPIGLSEGGTLARIHAAIDRARKESAEAGTGEPQTVTLSKAVYAALRGAPPHSTYGGVPC